MLREQSFDIEFFITHVTREPEFPSVFRHVIL